MIDDISKFVKNEMFGSNNTKKSGFEPALSAIFKSDLLIFFDEIQA